LWELFPITTAFDFRKQTPSIKTFQTLCFFSKDADLIAGETINTMVQKSRAHNSKKANFNQKKIDRHLAYIEEKPKNT
jgi:hypothetical protein